MAPIPPKAPPVHIGTPKEWHQANRGAALPSGKLDTGVEKVTRFPDMGDVVMWEGAETTNGRRLFIDQPGVKLDFSSKTTGGTKTNDVIFTDKAGKPITSFLAKNKKGVNGLELFSHFDGVTINLKNSQTADDGGTNIILRQGSANIVFGPQTKTAGFIMERTSRDNTNNYVNPDKSTAIPKAHVFIPASKLGQVKVSIFKEMRGESTLIEFSGGMVAYNNESFATPQNPNATPPTDLTIGITDDAGTLIQNMQIIKGGEEQYSIESLEKALQKAAASVKEAPVPPLPTPQVKPMMAPNRGPLMP